MQLADTNLIHTPRSPVRVESDPAQFTYVYLASAAHSGSTLLACLLNAHPGIATVGEFGSNVSPTGLCSCGAAYVDCPFWKNWKRAAMSQHLDFDIGRLGINLGPSPDDTLMERLFYYQFPWRNLDRMRNFAFWRSSYRKHAERAAERSVALAGLLCDILNRRVFVDTTKNAFQVLFLARQRGIRLKLIALVRDGRGVVNSLMRREHWSLERSVASWLWANRNSERAARWLPPENVFRLRLRDLCQSPEETIRRLHEFCGVEPRSDLDYSRREDRHIIGNTMRLEFDGNIRLDSRWRSELNPEHLAYFNKHAGWLNRRFGYTD